MFSASKPCVKTEVKQETETVHVKAEKETPKKQSPKKKEVSQSRKKLENPLRLSFSQTKQPVKTPKIASGKASISSFFSKPTSSVGGGGVQPKKKETAPPVKKEDSSNMFDEQSSSDQMDVDQSEEIVHTENLVKDQATDKNNKKRSIVDVHGENRSDFLLFGSNYLIF